MSRNGEKLFEALGEIRPELLSEALRANPAEPTALADDPSFLPVSRGGAVRRFLAGAAALLLLTGGIVIGVVLSGLLRRQTSPTPGGTVSVTDHAPSSTATESPQPLPPAWAETYAAMLRRRGGSFALLDLNRDGLPELYLTERGGEITSLYTQRDGAVTFLTQFPSNSAVLLDFRDNSLVCRLPGQTNGAAGQAVDYLVYYYDAKGRLTKAEERFDNRQGDYLTFGTLAIDDIVVRSTVDITARDVAAAAPYWQSAYRPLLEAFLAGSPDNPGISLCLVDDDPVPELFLTCSGGEKYAKFLLYTCDAAGNAVACTEKVCSLGDVAYVPRSGYLIGQFANQNSAAVRLYRLANGQLTPVLQTGSIFRAWMQDGAHLVLATVNGVPVATEQEFRAAMEEIRVHTLDSEGRFALRCAVSLSRVHPATVSFFFGYDGFDCPPLRFVPDEKEFWRLEP